MLKGKISPAGVDPKTKRRHPMRKFCSLLIICFILVMSVSALGYAGADTFVLPAGLKEIEEEAFMGNQAIERVVLPEGLLKIGGRAFAESSVKEINLPESLTYIADSVFENADPLLVTATEDTYAYRWAVDHHYIDDHSFRVSVSSNTDSVLLQESVCWTAQAVYGMAPYRYRFQLYREGERVDSRAYSADETYSFTFTEAGTYSVLVHAKDDEGETVQVWSSEITVSARGLAIDSVQSEPEEVCTTQTGVWTVQGSGGTPPYQYAFRLRKGDVPAGEQDWSDEDSFSFTFESAGEYVLEVQIRDASLTETPVLSCPVSVSLRPVSTVALTPSSQTAETESPVIWTAMAEAGLEPYLYSFEIFMDGTSVAVFEDCTENTCSYIPERAGTMTAKVSVTDSTGAVSVLESGPVTVATKALSVDEITAQTLWVPTGENIVWTVQASGGVKPLSYRFDVFIDGEEDDGRAFREDSTFSYETYMEGTCTVTVQVRDAEDTLVMSTGGEVHVYDPLVIRGMSVSAPSVLTGEIIQWTADVHGGKGGGSYDWSVFSGATLVHEESTVTETYTWAAAEPAEYTVRLKVTDENGEPVSYTSSAVSVTQHGATPAEDFTYHVLNGTYCELTGYTGSDTSIILPSQAPSGHIVQRVTDGAFKNQTGLVSVIFADTIESMGNGVFEGCSSLLWVRAGASLKNLGNKTFTNCTAMTYFEGWDGLASVGDSAFSGLPHLRSVSLPAGVKTIGSFAFSQCPLLTEVSLPEGLENLFAGAFLECSSLASIHLPDSIIRLDSSVFRDCKKLSSVNYPVSWKTLERCGNYTSYHNNSILHSPFAGCPLLTSFDVPEGVTSIPHHAFYDLTDLESVHFPETLEEIGINAFENCTGLTRLEIPASVRVVREEAFKSCTGLTSVSLQEGLEEIHGGVFMNCTELPAIHLPDSITRLDSSVFRGCEKLSSVNYPLNWTIRERCGNYVTNGDVHHSPFVECPLITSFTIPEGVTKVPNNAFYGMTSLQNVSMPSTLEEISADMFGWCISLTEVEIPASVRTIREEAFEFCTGLTSVSLQEGLEEIYGGAFMNCTALPAIHLPDSITRLDSSVFRNCEKLSSVNYPVNWTTRVRHGNYGLCDDVQHTPFAECPLITSFIIPEGVTKVPDHAFYGMVNLQNISLPSTLEEISADMFGWCISLTKVEVPASVRTIREEAFESCTGLTSVSLQEGLEEIYGGAFMNCTALPAIHLPDSITRMDSSVFRGCEKLSSANYPLNWTRRERYGNYGTYGDVHHSPFVECPMLTSITIPEGLTEILNNAFYGVDSLDHITLPDSLVKIGEKAFSFCKGLPQIYVPSSVSSIGRDAFASCSETFEIWCEYGSAALKYAKDNDLLYYYLTPVKTNLPFRQLYHGDPFYLAGSIYASVPVTEVTASLYNEDRSQVLGTNTVSPSTNQFSLSGNFNDPFSFSELPLGTYHFTLQASTSKSSEIYMDQMFKVVPPPLRVSMASFTAPSGYVNRSTNTPLSGTITANYPIAEVTLSVTKEDGSATDLLYTAAPDQKTFSIGSAGMNMAVLADGTYCFTLGLTANGESRTLSASSFLLGDYGSYQPSDIDALVEFANSSNAKMILGFDYFYEYHKKHTSDPDYKAKEYLYVYTVHGGETLENTIHDFLDYEYNRYVNGTYVRNDNEMIKAYKNSIIHYIQNKSAYHPAQLLEKDKTLVESVTESILEYGKINYGFVSDLCESLDEDLDQFTRELGVMLEGIEKIDSASEKLKQKQYADAVGSILTYYLEGYRTLSALKTEYDIQSHDELYNFGVAVDQLLDEFKGTVGVNIEEMIAEASKYAAGKVEKAIEKVVESVSLEAAYVFRLVTFAAKTADKYTDFFSDVKGVNQYAMECGLYNQISAHYSTCLDEIRNGNIDADVLDRFSLMFYMTKTYAKNLYELLYRLDPDLAAQSGQYSKIIRFNSINLPE